MDDQMKSQQFYYAGIKTYEKSDYKTAIVNLEKAANLEHYEEINLLILLKLLPFFSNFQLWIFNIEIKQSSPRNIIFIAINKRNNVNDFL